MTTTITSSAPQHSVTHYWAGQAGNSASSEYRDGTEVRRNLAVNPSFANNTTGWRASTNVTLTRDTTQAHSGTASGKVAVAPYASGGQPAIYLSSTVQPETDYILSIWVLVPSDLQVPYSVQVGAGSGGSAGNFVTSTDTVQFATDGWAQVSVQYRTPVGADTIYFYPMLGKSYPTTTDTFYLDDAMIETGEEASGMYFDGSTPTFYEYGETTPLLVDGWSESAQGRNILNPVLGGGNDVTLQAASKRSGSFTLVYQDEDSAVEAFEMHRKAAVLTLTDTDRPSVGMSYVLAGDLERALDDESREFWTVIVNYQEV